jgi:hypothetical protein
MNRPDKPFIFSPSEWLTIFPRGDGGPIGGTIAQFPNSLSSPSATDVEEGVVPAADDPAKELREQNPIDRKVLDATIQGLDNAKGLAWQNRIMTWNMPFIGPKSRFTYFTSSIYVISNIAIISVIWKLNTDGRFESKQLTAGLVGDCLMFFSYLFAQTMEILGYNRSGLTNDDVVIRPLIQLVRWYQLSTGQLRSSSIPLAKSGFSTGDADAAEAVENTFKGHEKTESVDAASKFSLLGHVANDDFCPCREDLCNLPRDIVWDRIIRSVVIQGFGFYCFAMVGWTAMITYSGMFWSSWWGLLLGIVFLASNITIQANHVTEKWYYTGSPQVKLATRLYHRASSLALRSFLDRAKEDLRNPPPQSEAQHGLELFIRCTTLISDNGLHMAWKEESLRSSQPRCYRLPSFSPR